MNNYDHTTDWYYEGRVSRKLVEYLRTNGYKIEKDNSDNPRARGVDIIAVKDGISELIEVKGYPTTFYVNGEKKGQPKKTNPKLQAKHWFSEAILSSIFNYKKHLVIEKFILALAFPVNDRYLELASYVEDYFTNYNIDFKIYFVDEAGNVKIDNFCIHNRVKK